MEKTPSREIARRFETDARAIVPVQDEIGGTAIYFNGRLAYYVLNGEWIQAVAAPAEPRPASETNLHARTSLHRASETPPCGGLASTS